MSGRASGKRGAAKFIGKLARRHSYAARQRALAVIRYFRNLFWKRQERLIEGGYESEK